MSIPNLIPHKTLYISGYIYSYYAFVFIFEFPEHISKHILQFHTYIFRFQLLSVCGKLRGQSGFRNCFRGEVSFAVPCRLPDRTGAVHRTAFLRGGGVRSMSVEPDADAGIHGVITLPGSSVGLIVPVTEPDGELRSAAQVEEESSVVVDIFTDTGGYRSPDTSFDAQC